MIFYLLGIDIGTTGVKTLLIDQNGNTISSYSYEYPLYTPFPFWAEQDPSDWLTGTVVSILKVLKNSRINPTLVKGIGLSGQMHSSVFLDKNQQVLRKSILWCDMRTKKECAWIMKKIGKEKIREYVANPALEGFTLPKIIWLRNNEPEIYQKVEKVLLPKDYIRFRMTGEMFTEVSDASGTLMFDVKNRRWSNKLLKTLDIPQSFLVNVVESVDICGKINSTISKITGLKEGTPVIAGGADNTCGAVGTGVVKSGRVLASIGTSGVVFAHTDKVRIDSKMRVHTFCHSVPEKWYLMGVMLSAGGSFRWFRDTFSDIEKIEAKKMNHDVYEILTKDAQKIPAGSEGLIFLPYLMGERTPHQSADARGCFIGITPRHTKSHFIRATLEGITFGMRDSLEIIRGLGVKIDQIRLTGGGAKSSFWKQLQADIYQSEVVTVNSSEGPAYGAAIMAGVGAKMYESIEEATEKLVKVTDIIEPNNKSSELYQDYFELFQGLYKNLKNSFPKISKLIQK